MRLICAGMTIGSSEARSEWGTARITFCALASETARASAATPRILSLVCMMRPSQTDGKADTRAPLLSIEVRGTTTVAACERSPQALIAKAIKVRLARRRGLGDFARCGPSEV